MGNEDEKALAFVGGFERFCKEAGMTDEAVDQLKEVFVGLLEENEKSAGAALVGLGHWLGRRYNPTSSAFDEAVKAQRGSAATPWWHRAAMVSPAAGIGGWLYNRFAGPRTRLPVPRQTPVPPRISPRKAPVPFPNMV